MAKKSSGNMLKMVAAAVVVVLVAVSYFLNMQGKKQEAIETARVWTVAGRACPTPAAGAAAPALPRQLVYEGATFSRERGPVNCNVIRPNGDGDPTPVCMFANPGALRVQTEKGTFDFAPRAGDPATVYVRDGEPECLVAVNRPLFNP